MSTPNRLDVEARSYELDPYGHLNNAVYANWLEHARLRYLADRGMSYLSIPEEFGVKVVVVRLDLSYKAEVRLGDRLAVTSRIVHFGNSSFRFEQKIDFEDGRPAAVGEVTMVCTDPGGASVTIPPGLRESLAS